MNYSMDVTYTINLHGENACIEIGADENSLDLVEIRWKDSSGKTTDTIQIAPSGVPFLIEALTKVAERLEPYQSNYSK